MASAEELLREAEFAFANTGYGSTRESRNRSTAKRYALRILRQYPVSVEAARARAILERLDVATDSIPLQVATPRPDPAAEFKIAHSADAGHRTSAADKIATLKQRFESAADEDWGGVLRDFMRLSRMKKQALVFLLIVLVFFPGGMFVLIGLAIYYATRRETLKRHLRLLLNNLG